MKAAIVDQYLDTLGGGERYSLGIAQAFLSQGYRVDIEWKDKKIKKKLEDRFGIDLSEVNIKKDVGRGDGYDACFWISDGSIPTLRARKNFLHFQVPFQGVNGKSLLNKMKLFRIEKVIVNSYFTKEFIDKEYGVDGVVIYPPVSVDKIKPKRKENLILFVGRFSSLAQAKRQDILIKAFKKFHDSGYSDWKLVMAGGVEVGVRDEIEKFKKLAKGYPIDILQSPDFKKIKELYGKAKFFWSASGYGVKENKNPDKVEHFGITVVEAMAAGAIPIVYSAGGHKEIVADGENGFLWEKQSELVKTTKKLVEGKGIRKLSKAAKKDSKVFEYDRFEAEFIKLI